MYQKVKIMFVSDHKRRVVFQLELTAMKVKRIKNNVSSLSKRYERVSVRDSFSLYQGSQLKIRSVFSVYSDMSFVISDPGLYRRGLPSPPPLSSPLQSDISPV